MSKKILVIVLEKGDKYRKRPVKIFLGRIVMNVSSPLVLKCNLRKPLAKAPKKI
jgi:hypothetical protein